jgi:hypothetical protein
MPGQQPRFEPWANFYVTTSAAAATLLGLFVRGDHSRCPARAQGQGKYQDLPHAHRDLFQQRAADERAPNCSQPTRLSAVTCICREAIAGLGYTGSLAVRRGAASAYYVQPSDLFPYVVGRGVDPSDQPAASSCGRHAPGLPCHRGTTGSQLRLLVTRTSAPWSARTPTDRRPGPRRSLPLASAGRACRQAGPGPHVSLAPRAVRGYLRKGTYAGTDCR